MIPGAGGQQHFMEKSSLDEPTSITSGTLGSAGGDLMPLKLAAGCTRDAVGSMLEHHECVRAASQILVY